jgi:cyclic pyranopterin phosphate synthase
LGALKPCLEVLTDRYGRTITDLRISITARCNFQCLYCHNEGQGPVQRLSAPADELSVDELEQVARVAAGFGIAEIKLSGGEPLARPDCEEIVARLAGVVGVSMVTNGSLLKARAASLKAAGLGRINVSLDAMDPVVFREVRRGHIRPVLEGIHAALRVGLQPVKLNMVVFKRTIQGMPDILEFVRQHPGLVLQLIQYMPEIAGHAERAVAMADVRRSLEEAADAIEVRAMHHRHVYHLAGARVELVDPVGNADFCAHCQRLRVTADGHLKGCLNRRDDLVSLRHLSDDGVRDVFRRVTAERMPFYRSAAV